MAKKYCKYSKDDLKKALLDIKDGKPITAISKLYNIPRTTLLYKKIGKYPEEAKAGAPTVLKPEEEDALVKWITYMASNGYPVSKEHLLDSVEIMCKLEKRQNTGFSENRPGKHWYRLFLGRHPEVSERMSQNLVSSRANVGEDNLRNWFLEIKTYLNEKGLTDATNDPMRNFNADETAFFLSPKGSKVLARKGSKTVYNFVQNDEKECITTLVTGNAAGMLAPPMVIFAYERIPSYIATKLPKNFSAGKSESGWMTGKTFFEYMSNVFYPWAVSNQIQFPIIFYVDGHQSHLTLPLSNFCKDKQIELICLYPNSTHLLQPMDVAVFHPLKQNWKNAVVKWRIRNGGRKLKKEDFSGLLEQVISDSIKEDTLKNGFRKCGLCPLNPDAINYDRLKSSAKPSIANDSFTQSQSEKNLIDESDSQKKLLLLEQLIEPEKICRFLLNDQDTWLGDIEDTSLFNIWKKLSNMVASKVASETTKETLDTSLNELEFVNDEQILMEAEKIENALLGLDGKEIDNIEDVQNENGYEKIDENLIIPNENDNFEHKTEDSRECDEILNNINDETMRQCEKTPLKETDKSMRQGEKTPLKEVSTNAPSELNIPSPFKKCLFWPDPLKIKKNRFKEKIPSVATSEQWLTYHLKKEAQKKQQELDKEERKRKRDENKEQKRKECEIKKLKKNVKGRADKAKNENENEDNTGNNTDVSKSDDESTLDFVGEHDYVIVEYEESYFPGIVEKTDTQKRFLVSCMEKSGPYHWRWPKIKDVLWFAKEDVKCLASKPILFNKRGIYEVPEMKKYSEYTN